MSFCQAEEDVLINSVAKHPVLYDASHLDYRNISLKENIWTAIAEEMNKSSEDCKKKWKFIRDGYHRFQKKHKLGTGSAAPKNSKEKRHQQLYFLDNASHHRSGGFNVAEHTHQSNSQSESHSANELEEEDSDAEPELQDANVSRKRIKRDKEDAVLEYWKEREEDRQEYFKSVLQKRRDDDVGLFCRHIAEVLRSLPPVYKAEAKKEIGTIVSNYEIKAAQMQENAHPTHHMKTSPGTSNFHHSQEDNDSLPF